MKLVNQQVIKNTNMKRLYTSIYSSPGISRAHLAKQTKLSKTTVSTLVDELIEREFIVDSGIGESDSSRTAAELPSYPPEQSLHHRVELV